jgi:DNA-binding MarR family transcriptional regulator
MPRSNRTPALTRGERNPKPLAILDGKTARIAARLSWLANFFSGPLYRRLELTVGLTRPEFSVLHCLAQCPNVTAQDICLMTGQAKNTLSRAIGRLLQDGRIVRTQDASDSRALLLTLTNSGLALHAKVIKDFVRREREMLRPLAPGERAELDRLLGKLVTRADAWAQRY